VAHPSPPLTDTVVPPADPAALEYAVTLQRLGIDMPADLASGVLAGYRSLRAMMELLRGQEAADV
jgi:hypothetical protein